MSSSSLSRAEFGVLVAATMIKTHPPADLLESDDDRIKRYMDCAYSIYCEHPPKQGNGAAGDKTPEEVGIAMMAAQDAVHNVSAGLMLSGALDELCQVVRKWAQHPKGRNWNLVSDLKRYVEALNDPEQRSQCSDVPMPPRG